MGREGATCQIATPCGAAAARSLGRARSHDDADAEWLVCPPRRAQPQSHGLGGVQAWHYDRHGYEEEKRAALERLRGLLEPGVMARLPAWRQVTMLAELLLQLFPGNRRIHLLQKHFATGLALLGGVFGFGKGQLGHG